MRKNEIEKELKEIESQLWFIKMKDMWDTDDREADNLLRYKKRLLEEELEKCLSEENTLVLSAEASV